MRKENFILENEGLEIAKLFYDFNLDEYHDKKVKTRIEELEELNRKLIKENKILKIKNEEKTLLNKKVRNRTYEDVETELRKKIQFIKEESLVALTTAEYLFINETNGRIDYTGIFINYVKALEIEVRSVFNSATDDITLGKLVGKLKKDTLFKSFAERMDKENIIGIRNRAVHSSPISKHQCGHIRQLLLEDGWLSRIAYLAEQKEENDKEELVLFDGYVLGKIGRIDLCGNRYYKYETVNDIDLLSKNPNLHGLMKLEAKVKSINGTDYYLI